MEATVGSSPPQDPASLEACLAHLRNREDAQTLTREMAAFTGVTIDTCKTWLEKKQMPRGLKKVKLLCYFESLGYSAQEIDDLQPEAADLLRIIGYELVSPEDMNSQLEIGMQSLQYLWRLLFGQVGLSDSRVLIAREIIDMYKEQLDGLRAARHEAPPVHLVMEMQGNVNADDQPTQDQCSTLDILAALLKAITPLAKLVESDLYTDEQRDMLRAKVGEDEFFATSNCLYRLSGPRARNTIRNQGA